MTHWKSCPLVKDGLDRIEARLKEEVKCRHKSIQDILLRLVEAGGKRLRPTLVWISGKYAGVSEEKLVPLAASVEILHLATLIHDDIIDSADYRRGIQTTHKKWDTHTAIFAGDYLFSKAFGLVANNSIFKDSVRAAKVFKLICEGEIEQYYSRHRVDISIRKYLSRIRYKTALLFALSCYLGAALSEIAKKEKSALGNYGLHLGMAFQIEDDILDITSSDKQLGKPVLNDLRQGIYNLPVIYGLKSSDRKEELLRLLKGPRFSEGDIREIVDCIKKSGSVEKSRELEFKFINKAASALKGLKVNQYTDILKDLLIYANNRKE